LRIEQSYPEKEQYALSLYKLLEPMIGMDPVITSRKEDKRTGKIYQNINFRTLSMPCLNFYHELFWFGCT
jgi:hypothetical protein